MNKFAMVQNSVSAALMELFPAGVFEVSFDENWLAPSELRVSFSGVDKPSVRKVVMRVLMGSDFQNEMVGMKFIHL